MEQINYKILAKRSRRKLPQAPIQSAGMDQGSTTSISELKKKILELKNEILELKRKNQAKMEEEEEGLNAELRREISILKECLARDQVSEINFDFFGDRDLKKLIMLRRYFPFFGFLSRSNAEGKEVSLLRIGTNRKLVLQIYDKSPGAEFPSGQFLIDNLAGIVMIPEENSVVLTTGTYPDQTTYKVKGVPQKVTEKKEARECRDEDLIALEALLGAFKNTNLLLEFNKFYNENKREFWKFCAHILSVDDPNCSDKSSRLSGAQYPEILTVFTRFIGMSQIKDPLQKQLLFQLQLNIDVQNAVKTCYEHRQGLGQDIIDKAFSLLDDRALKKSFLTVNYAVSPVLHHAIVLVFMREKDNLFCRVIDTGPGAFEFGARTGDDFTTFYTYQLTKIDKEGVRRLLSMTLDSTPVGTADAFRTIHNVLSHNFGGGGKKVEKHDTPRTRFQLHGYCTITSLYGGMAHWGDPKMANERKAEFIKAIKVWAFQKYIEIAYYGMGSSIPEMDEEGVLALAFYANALKVEEHLERYEYVPLLTNQPEECSSGGASAASTTP